MVAGSRPVGADRPLCRIDSIPSQPCDLVSHVTSLRLLWELNEITREALSPVPGTQEARNQWLVDE